MRFSGPSKSAPFAPLHLTKKQQQECQDLTLQLLDRTLRGYDERSECVDSSDAGAPRHHSNLDRSRWKQLKTQTNASLYAEKANSPWRDLNLPGGSWENPCALVAVGTIDDSLDEVMFGLETPDFPTVQLRSETLLNHPLEGAVLAQLAGPTEANPFQFMGVTWMAGERRWPFKLVAHRRDFVVVSATGVMTRTNGELVGYEVLQSIDLPQCPPLAKPTVRGKLLYGAIYRQRDDGDVDVFVQMYIEAHCHLFDRLVVADIWESALGFWNAPSLSEAKKLQWCMDNKSVLRWQPTATSVEDSGIIKAKHCENCPGKRRSSTSRRRSTHLSDHGTCALCAAQICSSCRVKRTLKIPDENGAKLLDLRIAVCRVCMMFVQHQEPAEIALDNQTQREAQLKNSKRKGAEKSPAFGGVRGLAMFSRLGTNQRYPSISVSDLVRMINSLSDIGVNQMLRASQTVRRKTDPLH
ncbi:hypothetical protein PHYPSEUDO_005807 [Phytophthora pseudosyringae]|uniref:FYVE-type domain-containing protein n=1 Tax=Phytophthora pseudosyringae TaxID=221518 RepID=A0A8T1VNG8_9STRA|nr:hypothetical protein PHYPSEUDO_005807 [Phytophthora pseudosyringae]